MVEWFFIAPSEESVEKKKGRGHWGHKGRPGKRGGSLPGRGGGAKARGKRGERKYQPSKEVQAATRLTEKLAAMGRKVWRKKLLGMGAHQLTELSGIRGDVGRTASWILNMRAAIGSVESDIKKLEKKHNRMMKGTFEQMAMSVRIGNMRSNLHGLQQRLAGTKK